MIKLVLIFSLLFLLGCNDQVEMVTDSLTSSNDTTPIVGDDHFKHYFPRSLKGMVLWVDGQDPTTIKDVASSIALDTDFDGFVKTWQDLSTSKHNHTLESVNTPTWLDKSSGIIFDGMDDYMTTADHADLNLSVVDQRTITVAFKTSNNITDRQVIFEEGGTVRGVNIFIESGQIHCGFWNLKDDGDDEQPFVSLSTAINPEAKQIITVIFNYSEFTDRNGEDGTIECFSNNVSMGTMTTSSRLHPHSGDIGVGAMKNDSYFIDGPSSGDDYFFNGSIFEVMIYNLAHTAETVETLSAYLKQKWSI